MKKNGLFSLVATLFLLNGGLVFGTTASYTNAVVADGPVSFWPLNETSGTVVHDVVGTNNGIVVNGTLGMAVGLPGILYSNGVSTDTAFYFTNNASGGGGYVSIPYSTNLNTTNFTVEAWLNLPSFPATGAGVNMNPLSFCNGSAAYGWTWNIQSANASNPGVYGWCGKNGSWTSVNTGTAIQQKWAYYVMTYDGTTFKVYTNGILAGSGASTYRQVNAGNALYLGDYNDGGTSPDGARYYRGGMENVAVYNYALTANQVSNHCFYGTNFSGGSGTGPSISTQPASQTNFVTQTANFSVTASGTAPLFYQWRAGATGGGTYTNLAANGQIAAVTNATLSINNLTLGNAGDYVVVVTNAYGSVTSAVARLTVVNGAPSISAQPASQTNFVGQTASFTVFASGASPLSYQWRGGTTGSGVYTNMVAGGQFSAVTNANFSISSLALGNAGDYVVVVTNAFGSITSSIARLTVVTNPPSLTSYQTIIMSDDPVSFWPLNETSGTVIHDIAGTNDGTAINAANGLGMGGPGVLYASGVTSDTAIYFTNNATGGGGYISVPYSTNLNTPNFSVEGWLNMPTFPAPGAGVNMVPLSFDNSTGYGWVFNIASANGSNPSLSGWCGPGSGWTVVSSGTAIQSQWAHYVMTYDGTTFSVYTNGVLAGSHASSYRQVNAGNPLLLGTYINGGSPDTGRLYRGGLQNVAVYDYPLTASQVANHYTFGTNSGAAFITGQPASTTNYVGQTASFTVTAVGLMPLIYQWQGGATGSGTFTNLNTSAQISAVTNATLSVSSLTQGNAGDYRVIVTNSFGAVTSLVARLTILTNLTPVITTQPASQTNFVGLTANLSVGAVGFPPLFYKWQAGVTNSGVFTNLATSGQIVSVTNPTLSITSLLLTDTGDYRVIVTNIYGATTSSVARLIVRTNSGSGNPVKIMCIGDSITDIDVCYWRIDLASNLVNDGYNILMVGRRQGTMGYPTQRHHEGYSGYTSSQILSMIPAMMAANTPDIAMVHIGVNDLSGPYPNKTADNLKQIILGLQAANSNMTIVISQIIPCKLCGTVWEYDSLIPQIVHDAQTPSSHVVLADVFDGFVEATMFDGGTGPHPNALGGRFMCDVYTPIIESILNGVIPQNPPLPPPFPGPTGFKLVSFTQGGYIVNFPNPVTIAYGTPTNYGGPAGLNGQPTGGGNGVYIYKTNVVGNFTFNNALGDPDPGFEKFGYVQIAEGQSLQAPPRPALITGASFSSTPSQQFKVLVATMPNQNYTFQMSTDLISGNWVSLLVTNSATNTEMFMTDPDATNVQRFYRVLTGP